MSEDFNTRMTLIMRLKDKHDDASWEDFSQTYHLFIVGILRQFKISEVDEWVDKQDIKTIVQ